MDFFESEALINNYRAIAIDKLLDYYATIYHFFYSNKLGRNNL
jgi:hypothetical protein